MDDEGLAARTQLGYTIAIADLNFTNKNNVSHAQLQILPLRPIFSLRLQKYDGSPRRRSYSTATDIATETLEAARFSWIPGAERRRYADAASARMSIHGQCPNAH
jgi:hypothetical protein